MRERLTVVHGARTRRERGRAIADDKSSSDSLTPQIPILGTILLGRIGLPAWTHREPGSRSPTQTTRAGAGLPLLQHHVRRLSRRQVNRILKLIPAGLAGPHISDTTVANDSSASRRPGLDHSPSTRRRYSSRISSAMLLLTLHGLLAGGNRIAAAHRGTIATRARSGVAKGQRVWLSGNAPEHWVRCLAEFLDASSSNGNVDIGFMCDVGHTCGEDSTGK